MSESGRDHIVVASIHLPTDVDLTEQSILHARVENIAVADRAPDVAARADVPLTGVGLDVRELRIEIDVPGDQIDPSGTYSLFVHVDVNGSGDVTRGDALTTRTHPVMTGATELIQREGSPGVEVLNVDVDRVG